MTNSSLVSYCNKGILPKVRNNFIKHYWLAWSWMLLLISLLFVAEIDPYSHYKFLFNMIMNCFIREWHLVVTCHQHYTRPPLLVCSSNLKGRYLRKVASERLMIFKFNFWSFRVFTERFTWCIVSCSWYVVWTISWVLTLQRASRPYSTASPSE